MRTSPPVAPPGEAAAPARSAPRTLSNGLWNAASNGWVALAGLVSSVVIVRSLTPPEYGVFSYYLWLASVTGALGTLALPQALTKVQSELLGEGDERGADALAVRVTRLTLGLNGVIALGLAAAWALGPGNPYLPLVAATQVPIALAAVASSRLWARQEYRPVALWTGMIAAVQVLLVLAVRQLGGGGPGFAGAVLLGSAATSLGLAWHLRRRHARPPLARPAAPVWGRYLAFLLPATLGRLFEVVIWQRSELFFIARFSTHEQIGFYSLAYTIYAIFLGVGWALVGAYYPAISHDYGAGRTGAIVDKVRQGVTLAVLYAVPAGFGAFVALGAVIELLYGAKMLPAAAVGQVLLLGLVPGTVTGMLALTVNAVGGSWYNVYLGLALAGVNVALDLVLIPRLGALGGAVANTAAQGVYLIGLVYVVTRVYRYRLDWRPPARLAVLGLLTMLLLPLALGRALPPSLGPVGPILAAVVGGLAYLAVLWRLGELRRLRPPGGTP